MKKTALLCMILMLLWSTAAVQAVHDAVHIQIDSSGVVVSGQTEMGGSQVTIAVTSPSGAIVYLDQMKSDEAGKYAFQFFLVDAEEGTYTVKLGGESTSQPLEKTFEIKESTDPTTPPETPETPETPSTPGTPGTPGGKPSDPTTPPDMSLPDDVMIIDEELLSIDPVEEGRVRVISPEGITELWLPIALIQTVGERDLEVQIEGATLVYPTELLRAIYEMVLAEQLEDAHISMWAKPMARDEAGELLEATAAYTAADLALMSEIWSLGIAIVKQDGSRLAIDELAAPVQVLMEIGEMAYPQLVGMYELANNGELRYVGGMLDDNDQWAAELSRLGMYAVIEFNKTFEDVPTAHWAHDVIKILSARQIIHGINEREFVPRAAVTRAEFAKLIVMSLGLELRDGSGSPFADVKPTDWHSSYIAAAAAAGIVNGISETTFAPDRSISRQEMAAMLVRAYRLQTGDAPGPSQGLVGNDAPELAESQDASGLSSGSLEFYDASEISDWAQPYVDEATSLLLLQGYGGQLFRPLQATTRAEGAQALFNLISR